MGIAVYVFHLLLNPRPVDFGGPRFGGPLAGPLSFGQFRPGNENRRMFMAQATKKKAAPAKVKMVAEKVCKNVVKYSTDDEDAIVTNAYVSKKFATEMPDEIVVTVEAG